jgi:hypothetical protein
MLRVYVPFRFSAAASAALRTRHRRSAVAEVVLV